MLSVSYENAFSHHTKKTYMLSSLDSVGNLKIQNLTHHENLLIYSFLSNPCLYVVVKTSDVSSFCLSHLGASTVCENGPCPPFATCVESDNENRCACPWCSHNRTRKICGSDWRTYKNFCELKRYACENNKHISVVSRGECEGR